MKKLKIEKSLYPEGNKTHLVVLYSLTEYGIGTKRIFKGSYDECKEYKKELENEVQHK
ncbi:MAG: hypothetical protein J6W64_09455 [Bacilli bacterium]|nr:hypothetical protein [Bacilli bacterium]